ncbi:MAG: hypothetical protein LBE16_01325, partial [Clostridiales Family XIII bacterium]|nr:hypothetical protein [Clostridiales Family XIII bacterium]
MNSMKRVIIGGVALIALTIFVFVTASGMTSVSTLDEDGYAVPDASGILKSLETGEGAALALLPVFEGDEIHASLGRYYIGADKTPLDGAFPIYIRGGAGLRFNTDAETLVSADAEIVPSFSGLYMVDGHTYNGDGSPADSEEFVFVALKNGLYMNTQPAVFQNAAGRFEIPANGILYFSESAFRWYAPVNGSLSMGKSESVFDATLTVGAHSYDYIDLLDLFGLLRAGGDPGEDPLTPEETPEEDRRDGGSDAEKGGNPLAPQPAPAPAPQVPDSASGSGAAPAPERDPAGAPEEAPGEKPDSVPKPGGNAGDAAGETDGNAESGTDADQSDTDSGSDSSSAGGSASESGGGSLIPETPAPAPPADVPGGGAGTPGTPPDAPKPPSGNPGGEDTGGDENTEAGAGEGGDTLYEAPTVTFGAIKAWTYAVGGELDVRDPAGLIQRGVKITVFSKLKNTPGSGDAVSEHTDDAGRTLHVYEAHNADGTPRNEGKTAVLRKTYNGGQTLALSPLQPGGTFYVQMSYRFNEEYKTGAIDPETGEELEAYRRVTVYSDFIEIKTLDDLSALHGVHIDYETVYAASATAMELDAIKLTNTSDYEAPVPGADGLPPAFDWENFKKDSLPYVYRVTYALNAEDKDGNPLGGAPINILLGAAQLQKAQSAGGAHFLSATPKLASDTRYGYGLNATDRWGNEIPMLVGAGNESTASFKDTIYTRKITPSVRIVEEENVTDKLTLRVKVSDPDGALAKDDGKVLPLTLTALDGDGQPAPLYGEWKEGGSGGFGHNPDGTPAAGTPPLSLEDPEDGKDYVFRVDSLAFARTYTFNCVGAHDPQPDAERVGETPETLPREENVLMGSLRVYTAALTSGGIGFDSAVPSSGLFDTHAVITARMNRNTTESILPLVDEFRVSVLETATETVRAQYTLRMSDLDKQLGASDFTYDPATGSVVISAGDALEPRVELVGTELDLTGASSLWHALLIRSSTDPLTEVTTYTQPAQIKLSIPENTLKTSTQHTIRIESVVVKGSA